MSHTEIRIKLDITDFANSLEKAADALLEAANKIRRDEMVERTNKFREMEERQKKFEARLGDRMEAAGAVPIDIQRINDGTGKIVSVNGRPIEEWAAEEIKVGGTDADDD